MNSTSTARTGPLELALANGHQLLPSDPEAAAEQAREILAKNEHNCDALRLLAKALRRLGQDKDAEQVEVQAIKSASHNPVLVTAGRAILDGRLAEAEHLVRPYLSTRPDDAAALRLLGEIAARVGAFEEAERLLRRAIDVAPAFTAARLRLGEILFFQNRLSESLSILDELVEYEPESLTGYGTKAVTLAKIGEYQQAVGLFEHVLERSPDNFGAWIGYGHLLNTIGRFEESVAAYRHVTASDRHQGEAWWGLANLKTTSFSNADIKAMQTALSDEELNERSRLHVHFALGKALEDKQQYEESFANYSAGNRIRDAQCGYRPEDTHELVRRSEAVFTRPFFDERRTNGAPHDDPIFVLGLPRAGSTLIEQILASHPMIEGTSELPQIAIIRTRLSAGHPSTLPNALANYPREGLRQLGEDYLSSAALHRKTGKKHFTDKLPNNWESVGLILTILPNARIVDARRHPMDCCFSNFKQLYAHGQGFTYSLDSVGRYYSDYVRMMDHFDRLFPGRIHRVVHEHLIDDSEGEVRRLLDYVGVPFEEACMRFYENDRAVRTPSAEQVRRPINRSGQDRWRAYEPWLGELKLALGPVLEAYPGVPSFADA